MIDSNIQNTIQEFIDTEYSQYSSSVIGILLTGSRAIGREKPNSDVDILIVHDDSFKMKIRGNKLVNKLLIEYFGYPLSTWKQLIQSEKGKETHIWSQMIANSICVSESTREISELITEALSVHASPFPKPSSKDIEIMKYQIRDGEDKLKSAQNLPYYFSLYYLQLSKLISYNAKFDTIVLPATAKVYIFLSDPQFAIQNKLKSFQDNTLIKLIKDCYDTPTLNTILELGNYTVNRVGGFSIDGWKYIEEIT